ncbi:hypothetical protein CTI14_05350 [Methylobacterium radiotolerans]|nr:hypothetical protein CTI14_05350 [Methylobacterium radiotolerans]
MRRCSPGRPSPVAARGLHPRCGPDRRRFLLLSGVRPAARSLWSGAFLGAFGLIVLQQLSGLFVGGATSNPLLASFASLLALLIWLQLSTQVILVACAYIVTAEEERGDRLHERFARGRSCSDGCSAPRST